jgi:hypothetical protein
LCAVFRRGGAIVYFDDFPSPDRRRLEETVAYKPIFCQRAPETLPGRDACLMTFRAEQAKKDRRERVAALPQRRGSDRHDADRLTGRVRV